MTAAPVIERVSIDGPAGSIEAMAQDSGMDGGRYAIVCHPHPLFGGTMENKVVTTVGRALLETGIAVIRFNFRGVGRSSGVFDDGNGETADADVVAAWGAARWPGRQLVVAGFSFGAYVALRLVERRPATALVTIAPPVGRFDFSRLSAPGCPWLVVQGAADEVVDPQSVIDWVDGLKPRPQLLVMPGVGHFFHGRLHELRDAVIDAVRRG
jgi:alpha/beta superfamily hydrolase